MAASMPQARSQAPQAQRRLRRRRRSGRACPGCCTPRRSAPSWRLRALRTAADRRRTCSARRCPSGGSSPDNPASGASACGCCTLAQRRLFLLLKEVRKTVLPPCGWTLHYMHADRQAAAIASCHCTSMMFTFQFCVCQCPLVESSRYLVLLKLHLSTSTRAWAAC